MVYRDHSNAVHQHEASSFLKPHSDTSDPYIHEPYQLSHHRRFQEHVH